MPRRVHFALVCTVGLGLLLLTNSGCLMRRLVTEGVAYGALEFLLDNEAVLDLIPDG